MPKSTYPAVAGATAAFAFVLAVQPGGAALANAVDVVGALVAAVLAGIACARRARRSAPGETRRGWALLAAACLAWAAGEAAWAFYDFVLGVATPFPSAADIGFLALPPLAVAGLLSFPSAPLTGRPRLRVVLDGLIVAASVLFVGWFLLLGPIYESGSGSALSQVLALAYPIGDMVLLTVAVVVAARVGGGVARRSLVTLTLGLASIAIADWAFAYLTQAGTYAVHILDVGWFAGFLLVVAAAGTATQTTPSATEGDESRLKLLFPYAACVFALFAIGVGIVTDNLDTFLTVDAFVLIGLVLVRQLVTLLENMSLTEARTAQLRNQDARFAALARRASDLVSILDAEGAVLYQSPSIERILGLRVDRVLGTDFRLLVHPDDRPHWAIALAETSDDEDRPVVVEWRVWHADGSWRVLESTVTNLLDEPAVGGYVLNARDVTERKKLEEELRYNAFHDALTGLANRALFRDRLQHALTTSSRHRHTVAVLLVDLHDFKAVNDVHGREAGDDVLVEVADRLRGAVRESDTVARFGGDEFAVLLEHADGEAEAVRVAQRVLAALDASHRGPFGEIVVHAAVGIATGLGGEDPEHLLRSADVAMYEAKQAKRHGLEVFRPHMQAAVLERLRVESELRGALERDELVVHYQPIVDVEDGSVAAVEALLRWAPGNGDLVPPAEFVPVAESSGLIVPIGAWVLTQACSDVVDWCTPSGKPVELNVNLSVRQLVDDGFVGMVRTALEATGLDPTRLTLEVTESMLLENADAVDARLRELKAMGVKFAIDDFGTGYSSLAYLHRLPVEELKIDRRFVLALREDTQDTGVVQTIISLARHFNLRAVAEGVEEKIELETLTRLGCTRMQGFLFAKPMPAAKLEALLESPQEWSRRSSFQVRKRV